VQIYLLFVLYFVRCVFFLFIQCIDVIDQMTIKALSCQKYCLNSSESLPFGTSLTLHNSVKIYWLNRNWCVYAGVSIPPKSLDQVSSLTQGDSL